MSEQVPSKDVSRQELIAFLTAWERIGQLQYVEARNQFRKEARYWIQRLERAENEPAPVLSQCPFCDQPADSEGGIWHRPHCEGLQDAGLTKLQQYALQARAAQPPSPVRTDEDYAIEHGRYLATAAEQFIESCDEFELATQAVEEGTDDETDDELKQAATNAGETLSEHRLGLASAIYEFRKRADRARPTLTKPDEQP
jgi:hypothetical protein